MVNAYRLYFNCKVFQNNFALNYMQGFCQVSATEASDPLPGTKEGGELPRQVGFGFWILFVIIDLGLVFGLYFDFLIYGMQVNNQVLVEMARDIRPPPLEPSEVTTKLTSAICFFEQCQQQSSSTSQVDICYLLFQTMSTTSLLNLSMPLSCKEHDTGAEPSRSQGPRRPWPKGVDGCLWSDAQL